MGNSHPVHEHSLTVWEKKEEDGVVECRACKKEIPGQNYYWCDGCQSYLHERCAKLARHIKAFFHPCGLLLNTSSPSACNSCLEYRPNDFHYYCERCDFSMCAECSVRVLSLVTTGEGESVKEQVLHCCHRHPLQPLPAEPESLFSCQICEMPCPLGPTWGCEPCNFHLHKACLDSLPQIVQTDREFTELPWVLISVPNKKCIDCYRSIYSNMAFCRYTGDGVDHLCIFCCLVRGLIFESSEVPNVINHLIHPCLDLKFTLSPSSTCNACFLSQHLFSYHCNSCNFFLCFDCAKLTYFFHWHPLKLFTGIEDTTGTHICNLCERFCSEAFYSCIDLCQFYVHKSCIDSLPHKTTHSLLNKPIVLLHAPSFECTTCNSLCSGLTFYCSERNCKFCVKCVLRPENVLRGGGRFNTILHWHQLSLCETRIEDKRRRCFLCKELCIPWSLCYKCCECALFFHKSCVELPAQLEHPIHPQHQLTLTNRSSSLPNEDMTCKLCLKSLSQDFPLYDLVYRCQQCDFQLDTQCAALVPSLEYKGHLHPLYVVVNNHNNTNCHACGKSCKGSCTITCADQGCEFRLHLLCGPLPHTIKHACHVHPLMLKEYYVEDNGSDEFACHVCEEDRDPRLRVYCCSRGCLMICDIKCVLNEVLPILRGERGKVELRTPFPQVSCRVINNKSDFTKIVLDSLSESEEAGDGDRKTKHVFSIDDLTDSFSDFAEEKTSAVETLEEEYISYEEDEFGEEIDVQNSDGESGSSSASEELCRTDTNLDKEVKSYSFTWNALSRFMELLHAPPFDPLHGVRYLGSAYGGSIMAGDYALPVDLDPIYKESFGMYNIIDHKCTLNYARRRLLVFVTCCVLHEMRITKVADVKKETILKWLGWVRFVEERGIFNVGILAENIKKVWKAHYYIQSRKIVEDKSSRLERKLEQVSMYKAELRTKMDELWIKMYKAEARHQKLQLKDKEHDTYRVIGSRGPMKKTRSDALEIKWRSCFDSVLMYPRNFPAK